MVRTRAEGSAAAAIRRARAVEVDVTSRLLRVRSRFVEEWPCFELSQYRLHACIACSVADRDSSKALATLSAIGFSRDRTLRRMLFLWKLPCYFRDVSILD